MTGLIDGFIYLMSDVVFGSALLFAIVFLFFCVIALIIVKTPFDTVINFLIIPAWYFKDNILSGVAGASFVALIVIFNAYILYKNINKFIG